MKHLYGWSFTKKKKSLEQSCRTVEGKASASIIKFQRTLLFHNRLPHLNCYKDSWNWVWTSIFTRKAIAGSKRTDVLDVRNLWAIHSSTVSQRDNHQLSPQAASSVYKIFYVLPWKIILQVSQKYNGSISKVKTTFIESIKANYTKQPILLWGFQKQWWIP